MSRRCNVCGKPGGTANSTWHKRAKQLGIRLRVDTRYVHDGRCANRLQRRIIIAAIAPPTHPTPKATILELVRRYAMGGQKTSDGKLIVLNHDEATELAAFVGEEL